MENQWDYIARIGTAFAMDTYIVCSTTQSYFTLGGDDETGTSYDLNGDGTAETAPFNRKMMFLTGLELIAPSGSASVEALTFDNINVIGQTVTGGASLLLAGIGPTGVGVAQTQGPTLFARFGNKPLVVRRRIGIRAPSTDNIPNAGAHARLRLWGFYLDRKY